MKTRLEDPNKKPDQLQKTTQLASEKRSSGLLWSSTRILGPMKPQAGQKMKGLEPEQPEAAFLAMVQAEKVTNHTIELNKFGTISQPKSLKECKQQISSSFEIEFQDLGKAAVEVVRQGEGYVLSINMVDKSKLPQNPLLFKHLVEKQLAEQFGSNFKIKVS